MKYPVLTIFLLTLLAIASPNRAAGTGLNMNSAQSIVYTSTTQPLSGTINNSQPAHYYRIAVKSGTSLSVILSPTSDDLDLQLIEDKNRNGNLDSDEVIKESTAGGTSWDSINVQAPVNVSVLYYVRVFQGRQGVSSAYNLAVSFTDADGPQPDLVSVTVPPSVIEGEEFTVTISADNDGGPGTLGGPDSAINASIKYSDNNHNLSVSGPTASWAGVYKINYAPGQGPIFKFNGDNIGNAVDHLVEASDKSWQGGVRRSMSFKVTPQKPGTLLVRARVTMRSGVRGNFLTDTTASGGSSSTDQQGWGVREYSVTVTPKPPPTGTITLTVRNGPDASFPAVPNVTVIRRSTTGQQFQNDPQTSDANGRVTFTVAADTAWDFEAFYVNPTFGNGGNNPPFTENQPQPEYWGSRGSLTVGSGGNRTDDLYRWTPIVKPSEVPGFDAVLVQRTDTGAILAPGETVVAGTPLKFQVMVTNRSGITLDCSARLLLDRSRSGAFDQDLIDSCIIE